MAGKLVIVESPAKAKTIEKYLGRGYEVRASLGHVRDLPKSKLGVDIDRDFAPHYLVPREKAARVKELKSRVKQADEIILATDPDREGEAIAWHLAETIDVGDRPVSRVEFHEITRAAVLDAMKHPRRINYQQVNAQQARRILDRLVGYQISPLLWKKVQRGLSAGRVQSAALRIVVEREREIDAFVPVESWSIEAELAKQGPVRRRTSNNFTATLQEVNKKKPEIRDEAGANDLLTKLAGAAFRVEEVRTRQQQRQPAAPFTTSTLQQEASRKLSFGTSKTMVVAQQLYEGIDLGKEGSVGLISYMRTDSTNVSLTAVDEARKYIGEVHGAEMLSDSPRAYRTRSRLAQEAHEAIRPTSVYRTPVDVASHLSRDQARLYELIWKRFVATQMAPARIEITSVDIAAEPVGSPDRYRFRAAGSVIAFQGFLSLNQESRDEDAAATDEDRKPLPELASGELLDFVKLEPEQHFTQPPPRFSEASLVRVLEEKGIGRPSTYAPIIATIRARGYVTVAERRLEPTELGTLVTGLLVTYFPGIVDIDFTAGLEERLDDIAEGRKEMVPVLREFYGPFAGALAAADLEMEHVQAPIELVGEDCEKCGKPLWVKWGRFGKFIACSGFPDCRNTRPFLNKVGAFCPECEAPIVERRSRNRKRFYGCSRYPECNWVSWARPVPQPCPTCGGLMVEAGRGRAKCTRCGLTHQIDEHDGLVEPAITNGVSAAS
ncbi:MAG: type I DNA topoisomerase [Chloroflexi bacterium]|nr:type I DNA topoisomerase [Chloroflexota bacterium]